jgi:hypothetical protein
MWQSFCQAPGFQREVGVTADDGAGVHEPYALIESPIDPRHDRINKEGFDGCPTPGNPVLDKLDAQPTNSPALGRPIQVEQRDLRGFVINSLQRKKSDGLVCLLNNEQVHPLRHLDIILGHERTDPCRDFNEGKLTGKLKDKGPAPHSEAERGIGGREFSKGDHFVFGMHWYLSPNIPVIRGL